MCESRSDAFTRRLRLSIVFGCVTGKAVEDEDLAPFRALVEGSQQLVDRRRIHVHDLEMRRSLGDFRQSGDGIGDDLGKMERETVSRG